jgi:hypothetical protein
MKRERATAVGSPAEFCTAAANFSDIRTPMERGGAEHAAGAALTFHAVTI